MDNEYTVIWPNSDDGKLVVSHVLARTPERAAERAQRLAGEDFPAPAAVVFNGTHFDQLG